jgi:hypothetical protein
VDGIIKVLDKVGLTLITLLRQRDISKHHDEQY